MIFCPHVSLLSLLLLMCGPFFHQTLAVTSLEALENAYITAGHYSNEYHQSGETNWVARPNTSVIYRPVDIPALNQVVVSYVKVNSTCTSMSFTPMNEEPATTSSLTQLIQYPLPDSWLEGVDGCVNPCG